MKRVLTCGGGLLLSIALVSTAFAGAIDNKTNWSAEYIRTLNRNAATDYADIAAYNPAGTVKLQDGFILNGSLQYLGKDYKNIIGGTSYESDEGSVVPGVFGVYNKDKWAFFGAMTVVGGGGKVDFSNGSATTMELARTLTYPPGQLLCPYGEGNCDQIDSQQLKAESYYLGYTIGAAYEVNDMFSFSLGLRYVDAYKEIQGSATISDEGDDPFTAGLDYELNSDGWGGILGVNIAPNDKLNIGMRYEMKTSLDFKARIKENFMGIAHDETRDLPATFGLGFSYWLSPKLRTEANFTYYFNTGADWDGDENDVDNGYDVGIALEYHFNDSLLGSIGYLRTETGIEAQYMLPENPQLDANTIGGGIAYAINEKFHTNLSLGYVFYEDATDNTNPLLGPVKYEKTIYFLALGLEYRF